MHFYQDGLVIYIWNKKGNHEKYWVHEPREAIMKFKKNMEFIVKLKIGLEFLGIIFGKHKVRLYRKIDPHRNVGVFLYYTYLTVDVIHLYEFSGNFV